MSQSLDSISQHWDIMYQHRLDDVASEFFRVLRDDAKLIATRCPKCSRVLIPPRSFCDRDYVETERFVELGHEGTLELFTVVYLATRGLPDPPYAIGYVRPDGADTAVVNFIRGVELDSESPPSLQVGQRMKILFKEERVGRVTDFFFEPIHG